MSHTPAQDRLQKLLKKALKLHREGRRALAEECYRKMQKLDASSAEALELGRLLEETAPGRDGAAPLFGPHTETAESLTRRAKSYLAEGKPDLAKQCLQRIVELDPESAQAHHNLGELLERVGELPAATDSYRRALALDPDSVEEHCHLARVLCRGGSPRPAAELYQRALVLDPNRYDIYSDLGLALTDLGNLGAAVEAFKRALKINPRSARTIASLGRLFDRKGDLLSASDAYRDAVKLDPNLHAAYADLGFVLYGMGEVSEALDAYSRLLTRDPNSAEAKVNLGLIHLLKGNFSAGWEEYEARWDVGVGDDRRFLERRWKGEPLNGQRILLYAEQGLGDTMQFVRYVPLVAARGGEVVLEAQPPLYDLLASAAGAWRVIRRGDPLPEFSWQCPLMSLPLAFKTEVNSIPAPVPYIHADPAQVETWRARLDGNRERVGLAWAGRPEHTRDRFRSIPLEQLAPLLTIPGTAFYSLQFGPGREQIQRLPANASLTDFGDELRPFTNLAALIANLDLVISIDSAVVHLAGAMGKPVWVLLNKGCDWRWFLDRDDSPWYPTARLFRQIAAGDWAEVVNRIERDLGNHPPPLSP